MSAPELTDKAAIERLTREVERLNKHRFVRIHNSLWRLIGYQFARGLAFGLGSAMGATVLFSVIGVWLSQVEFLPVIGDWASQILEHINQPQGGN